VPSLVDAVVVVPVVAGPAGVYGRKMKLKTKNLTEANSRILHSTSAETCSSPGALNTGFYLALKRPDAFYTGY